jgi:hypothetical protein
MRKKQNIILQTQSRRLSAGQSFCGLSWHLPAETVIGASLSALKRAANQGDGLAMVLEDVKGLPSTAIDAIRPVERSEV